MKKRSREFGGSSSPEISAREKRNREIARMAASEGIVLLKNAGILPLRTDQPVALFGAGAKRTVKGGTGSGDVNERECVSICRGLKNAGYAITSESWLNDYEERYRQARQKWKEEILKETGGTTSPSFFKIYSSHVFAMPQGRSIREMELEGAAACIYVVSRIAGENADRRESEGDYYLAEQEKEDIRMHMRKAFMSDTGTLTVSALTRSIRSDMVCPIRILYLPVRRLR